MDIDWQSFQRWVRLHDRPVNVIDMPGDGEPVVFVHGLSGCWQNWLENLPFFHERGHRVVALDLPGFGASPMPAEKISISGYGRTIEALLDELELPAATIVGNSMGGFTAAECAIRFPDRVTAIVLAAAAGLSIEYARNDRHLAMLRRADALLAMYGGWLASKSDFVARRTRLRRAVLSIVARHPERLPAPLVSEQLKGSGKPGFVDALDALTSYPIRDRLPEISCPTLIVHGDKDRLVPVRDASEFERLIPGARKVIYEDTGHVPQLERPARFNRDVAAFLDAT
jgi:pimeloyl-ACP methyl ester carboxylesterase